MTRARHRFYTVASTVLCLVALGACGGGAASSDTSTTAAGAVAPIPAGYHAITPSIVVVDVDAALALYATAFGATTTERVVGAGGRVVHAEMRIGDSIVMLEPEDAEHGSRAPVSVGGSSGSLFLYVAEVDAVMASAVAAGAELIMPASDMFWGDRYGQVRDANGHRWSIATHTTDFSPEEMAAGGQAFMAAMATGSPPPAVTGGTPATTPVPAGYSTVTPMLTISGAEALDFYVRALGATETERDLLPDGTLLHAEVRIGDSVVMFSGESPMEADVRTPAHLGASTLSVMHYVTDADATFARALEAGATTAFPLTDMFWGDRYGVFVDASGQMWSVATHVRDVPPDEIAAAAAAM